MITLHNVTDTFDLACEAATTKDDEEAIRATARYLDDLIGAYHFERRVDRALRDKEDLKAELAAVPSIIWPDATQEARK